MQQDYKFKQKPKFSTDSKEVTLLVEDFQDIMEIVQSGEQMKQKAMQTQATTNDKVTVQQTPRPRCPNGPDTYSARQNPRIQHKFEEPIDASIPVYDQEIG